MCITSGCPFSSLVCCPPPPVASPTSIAQMHFRCDASAIDGKRPSICKATLSVRSTRHDACCCCAGVIARWRSLAAVARKAGKVLIFRHICANFRTMYSLWHSPGAVTYRSCCPHVYRSQNRPAMPDAVFECTHACASIRRKLWSTKTTCCFSDCGISVSKTYRRCRTRGTQAM